MAFTGFINEFSNSPIQPTFQSYLTLDFSSITAVNLEWPYVNLSATYPYAQTIQVTINTVDTNYISMPDATKATQGQTNTIINSGAETILIKDFVGNIIATILAGQEWLITLTSNTTSTGTWIALQLASTTSSANAASLIDPTTDANGNSNAGGLGAFPANYLKENVKVNTYSVGSAYVQSTGDRGSVLVWSSGTGSYTLQSSALSGNGYIFTIFNNSTTGGQITVTPASGDTINNSTLPFVLSPGNSSSFVANGVNTIYSFASSQSQTNIVNLVDIDLTTAVGNSITLTQAQADFSIQKYVNNPSASVIAIIYPANIVNEWVVFNASTTNPINVSLPSGPTYLIQPGNRLFFFSDGSSLYNVPNFLENSVIYLADGNDSEPSLTFSNDTSTGLFRESSGIYNGALAVTQNATVTTYFEGAVTTSAVPLSLSDGILAEPSIFFTNSTNSGIYRTITGTYTGAVTIAGSGINTFYFMSTGNTSNGNLNVIGGQYLQYGIPITTLVQAYG